MSTSKAGLLLLLASFKKFPCCRRVAFHVVGCRSIIIRWLWEGTDEARLLNTKVCDTKSFPTNQERPYQDDSTASRLLSEVKHLRAWLVLRWGTTLEYRVLFFLAFSFFSLFCDFYCSMQILGGCQTHPVCAQINHLCFILLFSCFLFFSNKLHMHGVATKSKKDSYTWLAVLEEGRRPQSSGRAAWFESSRHQEMM